MYRRITSQYANVTQFFQSVQLLNKTKILSHTLFRERTMNSPKQNLKKEIYKNCGVRVSFHVDQGMREYMEDEILITSKTDGTAFFGVFDGHGGKEAAIYTKEHLYDNIKVQPEFAENDPEKIRHAIREGFLRTHNEMSDVIDTWPYTRDGFQSTCGTTATIVLLRDEKLYVAHVGDSAAVLSCKNDEIFEAEELTKDHKPNDEDEKARIESLGGRVVVSRSGVPRVVWKRMRYNRKDDSYSYEYVPFLAISRALGDLWSYDENVDDFIVSPEPDISVIDLKAGVHKFIILASDGVWGVMDAKEAVKTVSTYEQDSLLQPEDRNASQHLLLKSLDLWQNRRHRADNISAITIFFDNEFGDVNYNCSRLLIEDDTELENKPDPITETDFEIVRKVSSNDGNDSKYAIKEVTPVVIDISDPCSIQNEAWSLGKRKNADDPFSSDEKKIKISSSKEEEISSNEVADSKTSKKVRFSVENETVDK